jgi:hypothetical protein
MFGKTPVMPGLVPGIHAVTNNSRFRKPTDLSAPDGGLTEPDMRTPAWMAGTSPAMTDS